MRHRKFVLIGILGVVGLVVALAGYGLNKNLTYYLYPSEATQQRAAFPDGERFRLAANIVPGTLKDTPQALTFSVTDGGSVIKVRLTGSTPALFSEDVPLLLEGAWSGDVFEADDVLIRHDENYRIPENGGGFEPPSGDAASGGS